MKTAALCCSVASWDTAFFPVFGFMKNVASERTRHGTPQTPRGMGLWPFGIPSATTAWALASGSRSTQFGWCTPLSGENKLLWEKNTHTHMQEL